MKRLFLLPILILSTAAIAQDTPPAAKPPEPTTSSPPAPPRTEFYLRFSTDDLQVLNSAIQELPKKIADPYLARLNAQLSSQTQQANESAAKQAGVK